MNILIVNDTAHLNGGAARLSIAEALGLAESGHTVYFVAAVAPITEELTQHPNIEVICTHQYDLLADPNRLRAFFQGIWNFKASRATKQLAGRLNSNDTVAHLHIWSRALSSSVARAVLDAGIPTVCTLHDFLLACPTGTFFIHPQEKICTLNPMSAACVSTNCDTRSYPQKLWRVGRQVVQEQFGHIPSHVTDYIVHSELALKIMRPYLPASAQIHRLDGYIESVKTEPALAGDNQNFTYLGRLVREKGVLMFARSAATEGLPAMFVGAGPLEEEIRLANPGATITGWTDSKASRKYLRKARALVFPSLWYETLGLVVLEAASNGIPSIVPDTSAACELVIDGVTGLHFRGGDEADLRSKMRILNDVNVAAAFGRAAYDRFWSTNFASLQAHIASLEGVYASLLRRVGPVTDSHFLLQAGSL